MKKMSRFLFVFAVVLFMVYPVFGFFFDQRIELSGVTEQNAVEACNIKNIMDGTWQTSLNNWWDENFPGRSLLIKLRGQLLYSVARQSPNLNVTMEKDKYLFEPEYIIKEFGIDKKEDMSWLQELKIQLQDLDALLQENGKELYIFITPGKARFFPDKVTWKYNVLKQEGDNCFDLFLNMLEGTDLKYFDSGAYIEQYSGEDISAPVFYPTGIHWSSSWGTHAAAAFAEYISENSKWNLSRLTCTEKPCSEPQWPDADLYQSLNILEKPDLQYYTASIQITEKRDAPNVFLRGGSFMGQSLSALVRAGVFQKDVHLENSYYFTDRYTKNVNLSGFTAYDEMDLGSMLSDTDILILEVNESKVEDMGFGFIEYVLEHPELPGNN